MSTTWVASVTEWHWHSVGCRKCQPKPGPFEKIDHHLPRHQYLARGHVYKRGNTWFYDVIVNGKVVNSDNTGHWRTIFDGCNEAVWAFDRVLWTGHKIRKTWAELVAGGTE